MNIKRDISHMFVVKMSIDSDEQVFCIHMYMRQLVTNALITVDGNQMIIKYKVAGKKFQRKRSTVLYVVNKISEFTTGNV